MCFLVLQCFIQLGIMGYYHLNKEYIARNLCENRDKPEMHCNGKCQVKKMIEKVEQEHQDQHEIPGSEGLNFVFFLIPERFSLAETTVFIVPAVYGYSHISYTNSYPGRIFRPPSFV